MLNTAKKHIRLSDLDGVKSLLGGHKLNTVCKSALCPNIGECFSAGVATFLIGGDVCSRNCGFCAVGGGGPVPVDPNEPLKVAQATKALSLKYAVITSVTRDDLPDGLAGHFLETVRQVRLNSPLTKIEILVPDFRGNKGAIETAVSSRPEVFSHNVETVPSLYSSVRPAASFEGSLELLKTAKASGLTTKSGLMLGLGETAGEVRAVMERLLSAGCDILTIGQYLSPSKKHIPVKRYASAGEFEALEKLAYKMWFSHCFSGAFVRSSYLADKAYNLLNNRLPADKENN